MTHGGILKSLGKGSLLRMYQKMLEIRSLEEKVKSLFLQGNMPGTIHQATGMEACAVGVCSALAGDDVIASTHRPNAHTVAKGLSLESIMSELYGKANGCCKGKGGAMHLGDITKGVLPANAIVAANMPIIVGVALAFKMREEKRVAVSFFGDGACNEGAFHEALNMAAVYCVPAVFVCENNQYAASTSIRKTIKIENIAERSASYGMPGVIADGMDVLDVYEKSKDAIEHARQGKGPTLLELKTFRLTGHSRGDPNNYMSDEEKEYWKKRDPLPLFLETLIAAKMITNEDASNMRSEVNAAIESAVKFAQQSPEPLPEATLEDLYVNMKVPL